jgi:hypothetical protein
VLTTTLAVPAVPAGVVQVMVVASTTVTSVAAVPPMLTLVAPVRLVPVRVTRVAPVVGPRTGETPVTVGAATTVATGTALPLLTVLVVTTPFNAPALKVPSPVTVKEVVLAAVTVPLPAGVKTTVLLPGVGENPKPLIVRLVAPIAKLAVLLVITGITVATGTALPLEPPSLVTMAVSGPALAGLMENVTVNWVAVAPVTVPTALLLKTTVLLAATGSKLMPAIATVAALAARPPVRLVTTGAAR